MTGDNLPKKGEPILFLDIETLPAEQDDSLWLELVSQLEQESGETDEKFQARLEKAHYDSAMLSPLGRVWMIGYAERTSDPVIVSGCGSLEDEERVLRDFWDYLDNLPKPWIVGYNVAGFDIPFLQVRALKHGLPMLARKLGRATTKPWDRRVLDLMQIWPRTGADRSAWKNGIRGIGKLDTVCQVLGVERQRGVMGPGVYDAYRARDTKGVESHLFHDIRQVRDVFKCLWPIM